MLLSVGKGIRGGICKTIHWYVIANNKYMKDYDHKNNHHILIIGMWIIYKDGQCLKSFQ